MRHFQTQIFVIFGLFSGTNLIASPWFVDDFLMDDYSMDPVSMGYQVVPPPPEIDSSIAQRVEASLDDMPVALYSRLATRFIHPASGRLSLTGDGFVDVQWPIGRQAISDTALPLRFVANEATVNLNMDVMDISAGLQAVPFGTVSGAGVLDVASPDLIAISSDIGGRKVPALSVRSDLRWQSLEVSTFLIPTPEIRRAYVPEWQSPPAMAVDSTKTPAAGASTELNLTRSELGLYMAYLAPASPVTMDGEIRHDPYWLFGSSLSYKLGEVSFDTEIAYKSSLYPAPPATREQLAPEASAEPRDRIDAVVGLSYTSRLYGQWYSFITLERWLDDSGLDSDELLDSRMALAWQRQFFDNRQTTRLSAYSSLIEPTLIAVGDFAYDLTDQWRLSLQLIQYAAAKDTAYAELNGDTRVLLEAAWSF